MSTAIDIVRDKLVGNSFFAIRCGDILDLRFHGFYLSAQEFRFDSDPLVLKSLTDVFPAIAAAADPSDVAAITAVWASRGSEVVEVDLFPDNGLRITFANGLHLTLPTDTAIVDWHWGLTRDGRHPYCECILRTFEDGQLRIDPSEQGGAQNP